MRIKILGFLLIGLLAGCATNLSQPQLLPQEAGKEATRYLELANNATPTQTLEYRLQATIYFIQAKEYTKAQSLLRQASTQSMPTLDPNIHRLILKARLALLNKDFPKSQNILKSIVDSLTKESNTPAINSDSTPATLHIALLLPSKGPHAKAAKSIQDGFLAAYYQSLNQPSDVVVKIYDTHTGDKVLEAYRKALAEHATFIVGPLTKPEIESLLHTRLTIPVLALNTVMENKSLPPQLYQFGLMPEDEVAAIANLALQEQHKNVLILAPQNDWGKRLSETFQQYWMSNGQGGSIKDIRYFKSAEDLEAKIRQLLQVNKTTHRQDADMIFLAASPDIARHIKPLLSLYHADNLPIYATAAIYEGTPVPNKDYDLNGIQFCDMPWILQSSAELQASHQQLEKLWTESVLQSPRFFAFGLDAYQLAVQLNKAPDLSSSEVSGYTGRLSLTPYHRIKRELVCAKFTQGIPQSSANL
jgi:outer membrane PBP1 activator LpoA protein